MIILRPRIVAAGVPQKKAYNLRNTCNWRNSVDSGGSTLAQDEQ